MKCQKSEQSDKAYVQMKSSSKKTILKAQWKKVCCALLKPNSLPVLQWRLNLQHQSRNILQIQESIIFINILLSSYKLCCSWGCEAGFSGTVYMKVLLVQKVRYSWRNAQSLPQLSAKLYQPTSVVLEAIIMDFLKIMNALKNANNFVSHLDNEVYFCYPNLKPQQKTEN